MDKSYCIFGDSVIQAAYVKVSWVTLLKQYLEDKYKDGFINVFNLGIGGNTTGDLLKRFNSEALSRSPTTIIFAVGIDDTKYYNPIQFKSNLEKLIKLAKGFTPEIIFVGLVLGDWTGDEPFSRERTTNYNQIIKEVAESKECKFIQLQDKLNSRDFRDGLHPNDQGHRKMFEVIKKYL
jgi:lysophospholipase L1-like esterase